jgi:hypothetical protein
LAVRGLIVDLDLSPDALKHVYRGDAREVVARSRDGRIVRFPASILKPYVEHDGVHGSFRIFFDGGHRFQRIDRL